MHRIPTADHSKKMIRLIANVPTTYTGICHKTCWLYIVFGIDRKSKHVIQRKPTSFKSCTSPIYVQKQLIWLIWILNNCKFTQLLALILYTTAYFLPSPNCESNCFHWRGDDVLKSARVSKIFTVSGRKQLALNILTLTGPKATVRNRQTSSSHKKVHDDGATVAPYLPDCLNHTKSLLPAALDWY